MSEHEQPQLDYAPKPRGIRRRGLRRTMWIAGSVALLLFSALVCRWASERATLYYWTQRCMTFSKPPGTIAYEENPAALASFWSSVASSRDFCQTVDGATGKPVLVIMRPRAQWETSIRTRVGLNQFGGVFLHARNAGSGERIVCVSPGTSLLYRRTPGFPLAKHDFMIDVMTPGTIWTAPQRAHVEDLAVLDLAKNPYGTVRLFAGQPDPKDASHFTIDYQIPAGRGTIDGYLKSDDTVSLADRGIANSIPSTQAAP